MWLAVIGVALGSYALRVAPLVLTDRWRRHEQVESLIADAGLAAMAALVGLTTRSTSEMVPKPPLLCAVILGAVGASRGWSLLRIVVVGGGVYAGLRIVTALWA